MESSAQDRYAAVQLKLQEADPCGSRLVVVDVVGRKMAVGATCPRRCKKPKRTLEQRRKH